MKGIEKAKRIIQELLNANAEARENDGQSYGDGYAAGKSEGYRRALGAIEAAQDEDENGTTEAEDQE